VSGVQQLNADQREADSSPYQVQLERGFGLLRFPDALEAEYQATTSADRMTQLRQTIAAVAAFVLIVLLADLVFSSGGFSRPLVPYQGSISLGLMALMFWFASRESPSRRALTITGILLGLHFGYINLLLNIYYPPNAAVVPPDLWYVCGTFFIFFCFGLQFWHALLLSLLLFVGYLTWVIGTMGESIMTFYPLLFLALTNVFSAFGLYNIEYNQRNLFLQSNKLRYMSEHDPLTGLLNRHAMKTLLRRVWGHCSREKLPLSLAVVNIDCFRDFQQQYGQARAEACLLQVAGLLENCTQRPLDFVASYSSEEFVLVLPGCSQENAMVVLQRLQEELEKQPIAHAGCCAANRVTFSIGLVSDQPDSRSSGPDTLLQRGDAAVFDAGRQGGNTIVAHQLGSAASPT
jgi:diguanylate cyclase (GGDEF)-like protein